MTNNSEQNIYSVIELKKSLKRTIIQLQKAMDILNQNSPDDLPNLTVVEDLVKSSNALVDYLQLKKSEVKYSTDTVKSQEKKTKVNNAQTEENLETKKVKTSQSKNFSLFNLSQNLWLVIVLLISISFNIINLVNNSFLPTKNITIASNQEIVDEKPQEIEIGDNIFLNENIEQNTPSVEEKPYTRGENIFEEETSAPELDTLKENNSENDSQNTLNIANDLKEDVLLTENQTNSLENNQDESNNSLSLTLPKESEKLFEDKIEKEDGDSKIKETGKNEIEEEFSLLALTPEQFIIKNIESQITNITKKYGENLIIKVKANFSENSIVITLSEKWYNLSINQQNNFANDVFNQVKSIDFYKFKLENTQGDLLARNAVVGDKLIIIP